MPEPEGIEADKEGRSLPERLIGLAVGLWEIVRILIHLFTGEVVVPAQEDGGLVLAPEIAHIIQKPECGVETGIAHIVFHIITEEEVEIRILCAGGIVNGIEAEARRAVEVGSQKDFVVFLFRVQRPERMDLPCDELGNMFGVCTLDIIEARAGIFTQNTSCDSASLRVIPLRVTLI